MAKFIDIDGKQIRYSKSGRGEPLVLIHGLGGFMIVWEGNIRSLSRNFTVYALDLPGHGYSSALQKDELNLEFSSLFLEKFFQALGLDNFVCVGTSLGGLIAMRYTFDYPGRVRKLILVGSAGLGKRMSILLRFMSLPFVGEYFSRPKFVRKMLEQLVYDKRIITERLVEEFAKIRSKAELRRNTLGLLRYGVNIRGQRKHIIQEAELHKITIPTLLLWVENDPIFPVEQARRAVKHFPNAVLRVFPKTGHLVYLEQPEGFRKAIVEFALDASED